MEFKIGDIVRVKKRYRLPNEYPNELFRIVDSYQIPYTKGYYGSLISHFTIQDIDSDNFGKEERLGTIFTTINGYSFLQMPGMWEFSGEDLMLDQQALRNNKLKEIGI